MEIAIIIFDYQHRLHSLRLGPCTAESKLSILCCFLHPSCLANEPSLDSPV